MRRAALLALAATAAAWVLPDQKVFIDLQGESDTREEWPSYLQEFRNEFASGVQAAAHGFEDAMDEISKFDPKSTFADMVEDIEAEAYGGSDDRTVYQVIAESGVADKFTKLLDDYEDIRDLLNSSDADITVFAPSDKAFERIPDHDDKDKKPPKWFVEALLKSHVVPGTYSARQIFGVHTLPTLLEGDRLSEDGAKTPQRLSVKLGLKGIYINNYNRVLHPNIKASNGIIHGVGGFNLPPPPLPVIVSLLPTVFSTFELALHKTGLGHVAHHAHRGATVFAPANGAWAKLGWKANAFLFSRWGRKYLKAVLAYHIVANQTLYSDKYYGPSEDSDSQAIPKGRYHVDLPTLLPGKHLGVDIGRYGRLINIHVNHYTKVVYQDAIAYDGVLHIINNILIPPHKKHGDAREGEISVEELKDRLEPFVEHDDEDDTGDDLPLELMPEWENLEL